MMPDLTHLRRMTTEDGLLQFSRRGEPDPASGLTLDDNARALILSLLLPEPQQSELLPVYLRFLQKCMVSPILWHNVMGENGTFTPGESASADSRGRAFLALALLRRLRAQANPAFRFTQLLSGILPVWETASLRARAYILLGLNLLPENSLSKEDTALAEALRRDVASLFMSRYKACRTAGWRWYEEQLTYCNGILPHALLSLPDLRENRSFYTAARDSLLFLCDVLFRNGYLSDCCKSQ